MAWAVIVKLPVAALGLAPKTTIVFAPATTLKGLDGVETNVAWQVAQSYLDRGCESVLGVDEYADWGAGATLRDRDGVRREG